VSSGQNDGTQTITFEHVVAGTDRLLIVGVSLKPGGNETVSSVVWKAGDAGEQNLVKIDHTVRASPNETEARVEIWKLVAPTTGTANIEVTFSAVLQEQGTAGAVTFNGVDQDNPHDSYSSADGVGDSVSVDISSDSGDLVFNVVANAWKNSLEFDYCRTRGGRCNTFRSGHKHEFHMDLE
jgi:hypothetical protein